MNLGAFVAWSWARGDEGWMYEYGEWTEGGLRGVYGTDVILLYFRSGGSGPKAVVVVVVGGSKSARMAIWSMNPAAKICFSALICVAFGGLRRRGFVGIGGCDRRWRGFVSCLCFFPGGGVRAAVAPGQLLLTISVSCLRSRRVSSMPLYLRK